MRRYGNSLARSSLLALAIAPAAVPGCTGDTPSDAVSVHVAALTTITSEAESLTRTSSAVGSNVSSATGASGGAYVQLNTGSGVNDWIEFVLPGLAAGSYDFALYFKSNNNRGITQATLDGSSLGPSCDEYRTTAQFLLSCGLGSRTLAAGNHTLRFTVTGKNAASTGFTLTVDKIVLTPADGGSGGSGGGSGGTGGGAGGVDGGTDAAADSAAGGQGGNICQNQNDPVPAAERVSNGGPLLPPKWAFGVLWGSYYDQIGSSFAQKYATGDDKGNLLTAASRIRADYSGDMMWIDSNWLSHNYSTDGAAYVCFKFDADAFPDPGAMIASLRDQHFHFGVWEWAWMGHGCQYFQTAVDNKYFIMNGSAPASTSGAWHGDPNPAAFDYTRPAAFNWWVGLNKPLSDWGLDFMKLDLTSTQLNSPIASGGTLADSSKNYAREYHRAAYTVTQAYAAAHDPRAMLNGARGFITPKTSAPANDQLPGWWTDDTPTTWAGMKTEMGRAAALNTTSTAAYWCGDTGGYAGKPTDELYIRWLEYSTFTPLQEFFGSKSETGSIGSRFPWMFGTQAQNILKQYTQLRYRLLPFRYSNALSAYFVKPTVYPVRWVGSSQLLVGQGSSQFLVQPITTAGATTATVTLPAGTWIHYWTGTAYTGTATVSAPIDKEPIFVKAGSIIPMGPTQRWVDEVPADPLTLDIYPAGSTSYTLYEDDGTSEGYLGGAYSTTTFKADTTSGRLLVSIGAQQTAKYHYAGQLCHRGYILSLHGRTTAPPQVTRDGVALPIVSPAAFATVTEGWYHDSAASTLWVKFPQSSSVGTTIDAGAQGGGGGALTYEAENLAFTASAIGAAKVENATGNSNNAYVQFTQGPTPVVGDFIELTLPAVPAATYKATMYFKSNNNRGINQARIDGTNQGPTCDEYAAATGFLVPCDLGTRTLTEGDHKLRFTIVGKNAASSSFAMTIDKVVLTPQ